MEDENRYEQEMERERTGWQSEGEVIKNFERTLYNYTLCQFANNYGYNN